MSIRFGLVVMPQNPRSDDPIERFRECVEQTRLARDVGFDAICSGHHYLSPPYQTLQNLPLLSRLAADSGKMRLITGVLLLPLLNPVQVAEELATLDVICEGRLIFGIGMGYREVEFEAFGIDRRDLVARTLESLKLIKRLWSEDGISFEGRFFKLHDATCTIRPVQRPHPPIWLGGNADASVSRAARHGYAWMINPHAPLPALQRQWRLYRETLAAAGHPLPAMRPTLLELHVGTSAEEAVAAARPYLAAKYGAYAQWGQDKVMPEGGNLRVDFEQLARDRFVLGDPATVIEELERRIAGLESDFLICRVGWAGMENRQQLRAIELMGAHVLPYFRRKYGAADGGN